MTDQYNLEFWGETHEGFSVEEVKQNLQAKMKLSEQQLSRLFSGNTVVVKAKVSHETAQKFNRAFTKMGAISKVVNLNPPVETTLELEPMPPVATQPVAAPQVLPTQVMPAAVMSPQAPLTAILVEDPRTLSTLSPLPQRNNTFAKVTAVMLILLGLALMLTFSPIPDGVVQRGTLFGLLFFVYGLVQHFKASRRQRG